MATPPSQQSESVPARFVIPVRYVSDGSIVQTTTSSLSKDLIHVRSVRPPRTGLVIGLQLYFPNIREAVRSIGFVSETTPGANSGFWAELSESKQTADAIAAVLVRHRQTGTGGFPRLHTNLRVTIRSGEQSAEAQITNISRSGAFVRIDWPPRLGSVVDLDLTFPGTKSRLTVMAFVIHLAERRGFGVQFIGGSDEFRSRLDEYVARLAA